MRQFTNTKKKEKKFRRLNFNLLLRSHFNLAMFSRGINPSHYSPAQKLDVRMVCSLPLHTNLHVVQRQRMLTASREGMTPNDVINADASATPGKNTLERFSCHSHFRTCKQESTSTKSLQREKPYNKHRHCRHKESILCFSDCLEFILQSKSHCSLIVVITLLQKK